MKKEATIKAVRLSENLSKKGNKTYQKPNDDSRQRRSDEYEYEDGPGFKHRVH